MVLTFINEWFTMEKLMDLIHHYRSLGPLPGILLPMIEAFLPFLPLFLFVMVNANAFGLFFGFLYSWLGACLGALLVFMLIRRFGQKRFFSFVSNHKQVKKFVSWVDRQGFGLLFLLLCFPFTPSSIVNVVAGLSKINIYKYMLAVTTGKMVMIYTISYIGHDIRSLIEHPLETAKLLVIIFILWLVGKQVEIRLNKKAEKELYQRGEE